MVKVVAKNYVQKDKVEDFISLAEKLVKATVQNDAGCIHYELFQDSSDPQVLTIIEEWESMDLLKQHMAAAHFKEIVPQFATLSEKPGETNLYQKLV